MKFREPLHSDKIAFIPNEKGNLWRTLVSIEFEDIFVPAGTITDFASVPRILWPIFPPFGRYLKAAVIHDYLYQTQSVSRKDADRLFLRAMTVLSVHPVTKYILYSSVRMFGWMAWK